MVAGAAMRPTALRPTGAATTRRPATSTTTASASPEPFPKAGGSSPNRARDKKSKEMDKMNKTMKSFWTVVAMGIGLVACGADSIGGSATVKMSVRGIYADGSSIEGALTLGYVQNAVVKVGEDEFVKSSVAGSMTWLVPTEGTYVFSHAVGDEVVSATYTLRDGSASETISGCDIYAEGSSIDSSLTLGYAPTETTKAVVTVGGTEVVDSSVAGTQEWKPQTWGEYTFVHTVGADSLEAVYQVRIVADFDGFADTRLVANIKNVKEYEKYCAWVKKVAGDDATVRQAVKASMLTWFAYALDLSALPEKAPTNVVIRAIESAPAAEGGWNLVVSVGDLSVGSGASAADLGTVFSVEGAADLTEESFSADNVTTTFGTPENGKVKVEVTPKDAAGQFFFRMKMTP